MSDPLDATFDSEVFRAALNDVAIPQHEWIQTFDGNVRVMQAAVSAVRVPHRASGRFNWRLFLIIIGVILILGFVIRTLTTSGAAIASITSAIASRPKQMRAEPSETRSTKGKAKE
jgi:hypothetical protein